VNEVTDPQYLPVFRQKAKSDTVVIVGNGAVENGGSPLDSLFRELTPHGENEGHPDHFRRNSNSTDKAAFLAIFSMKNKFARSEFFLQLKRRRLNNGMPDWNGDLPGASAVFIGLRRKLADRFRNASESTLRLRLNIKANDYFDDSCNFVTTNWDNCLWQDESIGNLVQLHGSCRIEDSMILPTEYLTDELFFDPLQIVEESQLPSWVQGLSPEKRKDLYSVFRWGTCSTLAHMHDLVSDQLKSARRVVIWGAAMHTYDAELLAQVGTHINEDEIREIVVINTDQSVRGRVICITGAPPDKVQWINPIS
jgi:hypothetical protein